MYKVSTITKINNCLTRMSKINRYSALSVFQRLFVSNLGISKQLIGETLPNHDILRTVFNNFNNIVILKLITNSEMSAVLHALTCGGCGGERPTPHPPPPPPTGQENRLTFQTTLCLVIKLVLFGFEKGVTRNRHFPSEQN